MWNCFIRHLESKKIEKCLGVEPQYELTLKGWMENLAFGGQLFIYDSSKIEKSNVFHVNMNGLLLRKIIQKSGVIVIRYPHI